MSVFGRRKPINCVSFRCILLFACRSLISRAKNYFHEKGKSKREIGVICSSSWVRDQVEQIGSLIWHHVESALLSDDPYIEQSKKPKRVFSFWKEEKLKNEGNRANNNELLLNSIFYRCGSEQLWIIHQTIEVLF